MIKSLEALERIIKERPDYFSTLYDLDMWKEDIATIENALLLLEQIKKHVNYFEIHKRVYDSPNHKKGTWFAIFNCKLEEPYCFKLKEFLKHG